MRGLCSQDVLVSTKVLPVFNPSVLALGNASCNAPILALATARAELDR